MVFGNLCARKGMVFFVSVPVRVRVSQCRPSRGIHFPGEHPPGGRKAMDDYLSLFGEQGTNLLGRVTSREG